MYRVKEIIGEIVEKLAIVVSLLLLVAAYGVVSAVIFALPYTWLAGGPTIRPGGWGNIIDLVVLGPVVTGLFVLFWFLVRLADRPKRGTRFSTKVAVILGIWWSMPIICNLLAQLAYVTGYYSTAGFLFYYRYESFILIPFLIIFGLMGLGLARYLWNAVSTRFSGTSGPSDPSPPRGEDGELKVIDVTPSDENRNACLSSAI